MFAVVSLSTTPIARAGGGTGNNFADVALLVNTGNQQLDLAERYALAVLGSDFNGVTHVAAANYYTNPWVRDSYAWGMVPSLRDSSIASYPSVELEYWLAHQQPFGGWVTAPKSGYFDETPILISAVLDSYYVTGDLAMVRRSIKRLERAWHWLAKGFIKPKNGSTFLIFANVPPHVSADWADQVGRTGYTTQLEALWYEATRSLSVMEGLSGYGELARAYQLFASHIKSDINRMLWTNDAPFVTGAPPVPDFGHYRGWVGPRGYFELDSNFLCIIYGIADHRQAGDIIRFVKAHQAYLLGIGTARGVPARVLYGDYAAADYARKHERIGPGRYQSAYWPSVGALVAIGLAKAGDASGARAVLLKLGDAFARDGDVREWYTRNGSGQGAPAFGWAARLFMVALYDAYLGVGTYTVSSESAVAIGLKLTAPAGQGSAELSFDGKVVHVNVLGQGPALRLTVGGRMAHSNRVPVAALCAACGIDAFWEQP